MQPDYQNSENIYRKIWSLSWPLILANISVPLLGIVDTALLGHLPSPHYLAAVSVGASFVSIILLGCNFLRMSTTALATKVSLSESAKDSRFLFKCSVYFAFFLSILVVLLSPVLTHYGLMIMLGSSSEHTLRALAEEYVQVRLLSAPATFVNFVLVGWAIAWQKPSLAFISLSSTALLNILFDLLFILGFSLSSFGAALASVLAEWASTLITLIFFRKLFPSLFRQNFLSLPDKSQVFKLFAMNTDLLIRSMSLLFCIAYFNSQSATLGTLTTAANAILLQIVAFQAYALDGFANATEALVGSAKKGQERQGVLRKSLILTVSSTCLLCLILIFTKPYFIELFTNQADIIIIIDQVIWLVLLLPIISVFSYWLDGVAIGLMASRAMRNSILISAFFVFIPACYLLKNFANMGLWIAFLLFLLARSLTLAPFLLFHKYT